MILKYILSALIGYILGNIPSGVLIARGFGISDVRKYGSGNSGTTNVLRTVGWLPSVLTLVCDCLKGWIACMAATWACCWAASSPWWGTTSRSPWASRAARASPHRWR